MTSGDLGTSSEKGESIMRTGLLVFMVLSSLWSGRVLAQDMASELVPELASLQHKIKVRGLHWQAAETSMTRLSVDERRAGLMNHDVQMSSEAAQTRQHNPQKRPRLATWANSSDAYFNWSDMNGACWVTPVRNQGSCGSCYVFGSLAAMETLYRIVRDEPDYGIDLSEQEIVSCGLTDSCSTGGTAEQVGYYLMHDGVPDESCFPYTSGNAGDDGQCENSCADGSERRYYINDWDYDTVPRSDAELKEALLAGPLISNMQIYDDFYAYSNGVYVRTSDNKQGWHIVLLVGWDDSDNSWIVKNSWGEDWGMQGYFKIDRGEWSCVPDNWNDLTSLTGTCFATHTTTFFVTEDEAFAPGERRDGGFRDAAPRDLLQPDTNLPDSALPDTSLPDTFRPDAALPDTNQPDRTRPDTAQPDSAVTDDAQGQASDAGPEQQNLDAAAVDSFDEVSAAGCSCQSTVPYSGLHLLLVFLAGFVLLRRRRQV